MSTTRKSKPSPIADGSEVLAVFTSIMRGEMTQETARKGQEPIRVPPKISERCRAAQLIAKYHGLFDRKEECQPRGPVAGQVMALLTEMHERNAAAEGSP